LAKHVSGCALLSCGRLHPSQPGTNLAIRALNKIFHEYDVVVAKSFGLQLLVTNFTGNPAVIVPNGLRKSDAPKPPEANPIGDDTMGGPGTPMSITFVGRCYDDCKLLAFARAFQESAGFHHVHPTGF
jgi:Asp-tRNA(Asn)/Glu-tRNA(Gln) amidotransferase A subunit family amidase